jgi:predicted glutamine amidotransferase
MCTLILNPNNAPAISLSSFLNLWDNNPDGAGFAYIHGGKLHIIKEMRSPDALHAKYAAIKRQTEHAILLHFRISTQGNVNEANAHPFRVNQNIAFAHNGVISAAPRSDHHSDTALLVRDVLQKWPDNFIHKKGYIEALRYIAGHSNKFALLDVSGKYALINSHLFHLHEGTYYSNRGYLPAYNANPISAKNYNYYAPDWHRPNKPTPPPPTTSGKYPTQPANSSLSFKKWK